MDNANISGGSLPDIQGNDANYAYNDEMGRSTQGRGQSHGPMGSKNGKSAFIATKERKE